MECCVGGKTKATLTRMWDVNTLGLETPSSNIPFIVLTYTITKYSGFRISVCTCFGLFNEVGGSGVECGA